MILYFAKHPTFDLIGTASSSQTDSIYFSDDGGQEGEYRSVAGGYRSYGATVYFRPDQSAHVKEMTAPGNYILYKNHNGESVWLTILTSEHDPLAGCDTITAEDASMDLINETVGDYSAPKAMTIAEYINMFVTDSGFEIGVNEIPTLARTLKWESDEATTLNRILSVATQFDVELSFRFEISGLTAVKKYIDIHKHIGRDRRTELTVDSQLGKIVTTSDIGNLYTSVYAIGSTPEGANSPITLRGYKWTDPDGRYVLLNDGTLLDPVANQQWSRLVAKDALTGGFINRVKTYEAQTQETLLKSAIADLKQYNHPTVTYAVDIAILPDDVQVGDTVHLRDEQEQLFLTARVLELTYSYSAETGTATLGDYLIEPSEIDPQYRALAEELAKQNKGKDGVGLKSSIATYQAGTSGTAAPTGTWSEAIPTVSPSQFLWSRTVLTMTDGSTSTTYSVGKIGDNGVPGADGNGIKSSTVTYQIGTSGTTAPTGTWSLTIPPASQGTYLWSRTVTLYTDGTQNTAYSVAYQAKDGADGTPGSQDVPMTYVQTDQPTGKIVKDSTWWVGDSMKTATALKRWNGSAWIPDTIAQAVLNILELNAITINGSTFNGSTFNSTFSNVQPDGATFTVHGTSTLENGALSTISYKDSDNSLYSATNVSPVDIGSVLYDSGAKFDEIRLREGQLYLGGLYKDTASSDAVWKSGVITPMQLLMMQRSGLVLWSGVSSMNGSQSITPSLKLNECLNGWLLNWSGYNVDTQTVDNGQMSYTIIPKSHVGYGGAAIANYIYNKGVAGQKYIYASNTTLWGNDVNVSANPQISIVLRAVYAF